MTPLTVTQNPALYYAWLQWAMAGCPEQNPHGDNGNNATAAEQTIEADKSIIRDPLTDIACQRPARSLGRAA